MNVYLCKDYGPGYAWSIPFINISVGDTINWSWSPPVGIYGVAYQVLQVADAASFEPSGFTSGTPSASGSFSYQFNQPGTYNYWSGYVESSNMVQFRGVVQVSNSSNIELDINVSLNKFNAQKCSFPFTYNSNSYSSCTTDGFGYNWCSPTPTFNNQIIKCDPAGKLIYSFYFRNVV